jgi:hypothetical protein
MVLAQQQQQHRAKHARAKATPETMHAKQCLHSMMSWYVKLQMNE